MYTNLHTAVKSLASKLYTFAGHSIDPTHSSFCFDCLARAIDAINADSATVSVNFDGEIYVHGYNAHVMPVVVTVSGSNIFSALDITIQKA